MELAHYDSQTVQMSCFLVHTVLAELSVNREHCGYSSAVKYKTNYADVSSSLLDFSVTDVVDADKEKLLPAAWRHGPSQSVSRC